MNEAAIEGVKKYWQDVRSGIRKSPRVTYAENKANKKRIVDLKHIVIDELEQKIEQLQTRLNNLKQQELFSEYAMAITNKAMVSQERIIDNAISYDQTCGIYFLLKDTEILYVGQSVCVFSRIRAHDNERRIKFDRIAWVECKKEHLDTLESLYIHLFKPVMNGSSGHDGKQAPLSMEQIAKFLLAQNNSDIIRGRRVYD